jgi:hypothetical protein
MDWEQNEQALILLFIFLYMKLSKKWRMIVSIYTPLSNGIVMQLRQCVMFLIKSSQKQKKNI